MTAAGSWRGSSVLITGGSGFIGRHLTRRLIADGAVVSVLSRAPSTIGQPTGVRNYIGDIREADAVRRTVDESEPEVVFHLASTRFNPPGTPDREHVDVIIGGTSNVLSALAGRSVRLVHIGSAAEYGAGSMLREDAPLRPATILGAAKAAATILVQATVRERHQDAVILRLFTPYGPWDHHDRLIMHAARRASAGLDTPISDGRQKRDFVYIEDVVDALLLGGRRPLPAGAVFNVSSGEGVSIREAVEAVIDVLKSATRAIPGAVATRADEIWDLSGDNSAAARDLGWKPKTKFREGIAKTCAWVLETRASAVRSETPDS
jgi:nucleoside-diphosphate-sugar epimerase